MTAMHEDSMKKYIKAVGIRIITDVKGYGVAVAAVLLYAVAVNLIFHAFCPLVILSGFPCPGCGVSRATLCFMTGRWQSAWQMNPVIFPIVLFAAYFCLCRYLLGRKVKGAKTGIAVILVLLFIVCGCTSTFRTGFRMFTKKRTCWHEFSLFTNKYYTSTESCDKMMR